MQKETMTPRERVIRTLSREQVDRVPIDLGSHTSTGISAFDYWELREHLGLSTDNIQIVDTVQFLARVDEGIRRRFHCDCIMLQPPWPQTRWWNPRGKYQFPIPESMKPEQDSNGDWVVHKEQQTMRMPVGGYFFDGSWITNWVDESEDEHIARYAHEAERIYKETPYATNYRGFGSFFGGIDHAIRMITKPDAVLEGNARSCDNLIRRFRKVNDAMGKYIQLITVGNDMGGQSGPLCDPRDIERFCMPFYKKFCDFVHQNSDIKVFMHNCGALRPLIPMFIEAGIDVLSPVQISADGMEPQGLKDDFGDDIIFWGGGCDTQYVLGIKSPQEVSEHVQENVRIFKQGGGFVFTQVHNIVGNVPPENIIAMLDAAYEESFY